jgi:hypothetical protein
MTPLNKRKLANSLPCAPQVVIDKAVARSQASLPRGGPGKLAGNLAKPAGIKSG